MVIAFPKKKTRKYLEATHQKAFFAWLKLKYPWARDVTFAIPNGGKRNSAEAANLKAQGVTAGVPDVFCCLARAEHHGLFIEFKSPQGKLTAKQKIFIEKIQKQDYCVAICYSVDDAIRAFEFYLMPFASVK